MTEHKETNRGKKIRCKSRSCRALRKNLVQIAKFLGTMKSQKAIGFRVKNKRFEEQIAKKLGKSRQVPDERGGFRGGPSQRSWAPPTDEILFRPPPKVTSHTCWPGHKTESQRSWAPLTDEGTSRKRGSSQRKGLVICIFPFCRSKLHA